MCIRTSELSYRMSKLAIENVPMKITKRASICLAHVVSVFYSTLATTKISYELGESRETFGGMRFVCNANNYRGRQYRSRQ